ncbi:GlcNAc-transferase family protein [Aliarcobacter vitoriensis]|uniref:GlcNAc-transferase family protein n=1 Tax=Aliarcobacter vitoriensis TaxID=2011099 RepID=UPI003AAE42C3
MADKIFVALASYCDDMLEFTIKSAYNSAKNKENIIFGVVEQNYENNRESIKSFEFSQQIRYCHIFPNDSLGVSWARHLCFSLYDNEEYFLQVDSHTYFEENWDENLIYQYNELLNKSNKPIISTYPYGFTIDENSEINYNKPSGKTILVLRPKSELVLTKDNLVLQFRAEHIHSSEAILGCHIAAGFLFAKGNFIEEIPYDPYLYFHGEEQSLAIRSFTKGWDIYHPKWIPLYHLYKKVNTKYDTHHWSGDTSKQRDFEWTYLQTRAKKRLEKLIFGELNDSIYGLGNIRTLQQYIEFSKIDYFNLSFK